MVDALGNPLAFFLTDGQTHDLQGADALLPQVKADTVLADTAFDVDERVIEPLFAKGKTAVIRPRAVAKSRHAISSRIASASSSNSGPSPLAMTRPPETSSPVFIWSPA
jgi:hypothetical protein